MKQVNKWEYYVFLSCLCCMISCQTTQRSPQISQTPNNVIDEANALFQHEKYEAALAKYSNYVYSPFPNKQDLASARYYMGICQYFLGQYAEAVDSLTILLRSHPGFEYESEVIQLIKQSQSKTVEQKEMVQQKQINKLNQIVELQQKLENTPNDSQLHYQLGNQYWDSGDYKKAALHYEQAILQNPEYEKNNLIRKRVYYNDNDVLVPRDPVTDLQDQDETIRLSNIRQDVRKRTDFLGRIESIRVSGEAKNVSLRTVNGVSVEITLVDFFERIQDSQTVSLGSIRPGQVRTFSILLDQFSGSANDNLKVRTQVFYD